MSFRAHLTHPVTGRRFWVRAPSRVKLNAYRSHVDTLRSELRLGTRSAADVDRQLRRLRFGIITLERATWSYLGRKLSPNTKDRVRGYLRTHFAALASVAVDELDARRLAAWVRVLERDLHPTSLGTVWRSLRAIVAHAAEKGWIGGCPWGPWSPKLSGAPARATREAARSVVELARILAAARELDDEGRRYLPMYIGDLEAKIATAALLGLRQGELAGLRWCDIEWGPPVTVLVARQWAGRPLKKGAQPRRLETIDELGEILARHRDALARWSLWAAAGPVFPDRKSAYGSPRAYARGEVITRLQLRSAIERTGLPHLASWSAHSLRDSFVTLEANAVGGDLARVAARSRHASIASLARYLRAHTRDSAPPAIVHLPSAIADSAAPRALVTHEPPETEEPPP